MRPQENGNKTEVRWAAVGNEALTSGILVSSHNTHTIDVSAHHYTLEDFDSPTQSKNEQKHRHGSSNELKLTNDLTTFCVDHAQMGVGGIDSWGARPLPQRMPTSDPVTWSFRLKGFGPGDPTIPGLARQRPFTQIKSDL